MVSVRSHSAGSRGNPTESAHTASRLTTYSRRRAMSQVAGATAVTTARTCPATGSHRAAGSRGR